MAHYKYIICTLLCVCAVACRQEEPAISHLVVEGWIEPGQHPLVMLHRSCPYSQIDTAYEDIEDLVTDYMLPFGKVTISNGDTTVVLTGRVNRSYMPPYTYSSVYMKGEEGNTYYLTVQAGDYYATAQTTIPRRAAFDSIRTELYGEDRVQVVGYMHQVPPHTHYLIFARYSYDTQYLLCPLGALSSPDSIADLQVNIYSPYGESDSTKAFTNAMFRQSEKNGVFVKIASVNEEEFAFWNSFSSTALTSGVLFIPIRQNITSNIHGGIGYWCGMGSTEHYVPLSHSRTYTYPH